MKLLGILAALAYNCQFALSHHRWVNWGAPWLEREHDPSRYVLPPPRVHEGIELPLVYESPDFRLDEDPNSYWIKADFYREENRPYRLSPHWKMTQVWTKERPYEYINYAGCYCTTVFKRLTPLAGCALITTRHILTTATSTHLILRDRLHYQILEDILGAWYDTNHDTFNSSMYFTPSRIHYHPNWHYPEQVNRSHPFSFSNDLAVWASTHTVYGWYAWSTSAILCLRATSHACFRKRQRLTHCSVRSWSHGPPSPHGEQLHIIVGFQFMYAFKRKPMPWFKYAVRTWSYTEPCPKTEWGWFICIPGEWATFGVESGAALHRSDMTWKYDGLVGMAAFSMRLRSAEITHYFLALDCYPVLDFLYDAYGSQLPYIWKDERFHDTKNGAPVAKSGYYIAQHYATGTQYPYDPIYFS